MSTRLRIPTAAMRAETSTEAIRFSRISSVALTRVVPDPAAYVPGVTVPSEVMLTIGWNVVSHLELEPAHCGDENCEADHGYLGTITADDFSLRVSQDADGDEAVRSCSVSRECCPTPRQPPSSCARLPDS